MFNSNLSCNGADKSYDGSTARFPSETPIAMAYVPFQQWETPYAENKALSAGTIFPSLDLPFMGRSALK